MDITVFTGRMPLEELKRDKPREYEALVAAGKLDENMGEAYQPIVTRTIRAFAWVALGLDSALRCGSFMPSYSPTNRAYLRSMHRRTYKCSLFVLLYFPWL